MIFSSIVVKLIVTIGCKTPLRESDVARTILKPSVMIYLEMVYDADGLWLVFLCVASFTLFFLKLINKKLLWNNGL